MPVAYARCVTRMALRAFYRYLGGTTLAMQALIVEDSRVVATILRARLEHAGFQVAAATTRLRDGTCFSLPSRNS